MWKSEYYIFYKNVKDIKNIYRSNEGYIFRKDKKNIFQSIVYFFYDFFIIDKRNISLIFSFRIYESVLVAHLFKYLFLEKNGYKKKPLYGFEP